MGPGSHPWEQACLRGHAPGPISPGPRGWSNGVLPGSPRRATHLPSTARQGGLVQYPSGTPMSLHVGSRQSNSTASLRPGPISGGHAAPERGPRPNRTGS